MPRRGLGVGSGDARYVEILPGSMYSYAFSRERFEALCEREAPRNSPRESMTRLTTTIAFGGGCPRGVENGSKVRRGVSRNRVARLLRRGRRDPHFGFKADGSSFIAGVVATALAFGLTLLALAYVLGPISGCHVNPAVTLGALVAGRISLRDAATYWVAQFIGGVLAAWRTERSFPRKRRRQWASPPLKADVGRKGPAPWPG